ncbi:hypothetical protein ABZ815_20095 [Nonomuraea sp. NPDC047529]|uniref:hypothetical protein n=1 Tax=Nonomuraea sp. NPDC047529 TaxID=3155623 RepID=UPI0033D4B41E
MQVITPGEPMRFGLRLVAYQPNGPRLGVLGRHLGFEMGMPLNDTPSLKVTYSGHAADSQWLASPCEVAVEWSAGGAWTEPANGRFLRIKRSGDGADQALSRSYDMPGYSWMLRKLTLYPAIGMIDGKRQFPAASVGDIVSQMIDEAQGRGTLPGLSYDFDAAQDSNGQEWAATLTLGLDPGTDLLAVLINLGEQGVCDWQMQGRTLQVFNPDTVLGRQLGSGPAPVELRLGRDIDQAPDDATFEDAASAILITGEDGLSVEVTNPGAAAPWGRWEVVQSQGGVKDEGTARLLAQYALDRASGERVQLTRQITPYAARFLPLRDYRPGDTIRAPGDQAVMQALRIRQITLSVDGDGLISGNLVLNDRFLERDIRLARRANGILSGGVSEGGNGGEPAPESKDRVPAAPTGLVVNPQAYLDAEGYAHGLIAVSWLPVSTDVNGVSLAVDGYELIGQTPPGTGAERVLGHTDGTSISYSPLTPKSQWRFGVRATNQGVKGQLATSAVITIPDDETPPPIPSTPVVDSRLGIVRVTWDGLTSSGTGMPADFHRVLVMVRDPLDPEDEGQAVEWLERAGTAVVPGLPYNADREFWLVALDRSGNVSGESARAVAATHPLVDTDLIGEVIDGAEHIISGSIPADAKIVAGSITGGLIQALAIQAGHIQANAVTADKIVAGAIQTGHLAAAAITADKLAAGSVTASTIAADAITGKTITGSVMRSSATGRRFVLDSSTLDLRFYPASNNNYTRIYAEDGWYSGETTTFITSGTNSGGTARAELQVAAGLVRLGIRDASFSNRQGGGLDVAEGYAMFGYSTGSSSFDTFIYLNSTGRFYIRGRVWDANETSPYDAFAAGSVSVGGAASPNWAIYRYGPPSSPTSMATNMGPVVALRDGGSGGPSAFTNNYVPKAWALTASDTSGFQVNLANSTSFAFYFWAHRH